jgi:hypothetical protein
VNGTATASPEILLTGGDLPPTMCGVRQGAARKRHREPGEGRPNRGHSATTCQRLQTAAPHTGNMGSSYYERIGVRYSATRRPDSRIADVIFSALGDSASVVNVGAGTGSYEPTDRRVVAVDPSRVMLAQRAPDAAQQCRHWPRVSPSPTMPSMRQWRS